METAAQNYQSPPSSNQISSEDLNFESVFNRQTLISDPEEVKVYSAAVRPVKYLNLEKQKTLEKAGMIKPLNQPQPRVIPDRFQQDFSSVLLPSFQKTKATLFKHQLLNEKTAQPSAKIQDKKVNRQKRHLSPLCSKEISQFMQQSQKTNLMWTTMKYSSNNTQSSLKTTQADDNTSLGLFPSKFRSKSIKPNPIRLLNDESKEIQTQKPFHLQLSQTQSSAFYKPKASHERYQAIFKTSNLHGFETQRQLKMKQIVEEVEIPKPIKVDPSLVPQAFQKTRIAGFSPPAKLILPACFCVKDEVCNNHTDVEPKIDMMLDLIENQIDTLLQDDLAIDENLRMISKTSEKLMTSRKDTFKENLMGEYRNRQDEIMTLENQVAHMSLQEHQHEQITRERDLYAEQLQMALSQMDQFGTEVFSCAQISRQEIEDLTQSQLGTQTELQLIRNELSKVTQESKAKSKLIEQTQQKIKEQQELLIDLNTENARIAKENETFRRFFVLNNAMLVTHKDDPAYIRHQVDEMYKDFGKAVNNSGTYIKDGFDKIEKLVNDKLLNKNKALASILKD